MKRAAESNTIGESDTRYYVRVDDTRRLGEWYCVLFRISWKVIEKVFVSSFLLSVCLPNNLNWINTTIRPNLHYRWIVRQLCGYNTNCAGNTLKLIELLSATLLSWLKQIQTTNNSVFMPHFVSHADNYRKVVKEECKVLLRSVIRARARRTKYRIVSNPSAGWGRPGIEWDCFLLRQMDHVVDEMSQCFKIPIRPIR